VIEIVKKGFYITTPLYYLNGPPHIGHAYTTIVADVIARWHRLKGEKVFFLTGTDEHGEKVLQAAEKAGKGARQFVDELSTIFRNTWDTLDISYDDFIRTTEDRHKRVVREFILAANKRGDIYKGEYEGYYCVGCESFKTEKEIQGGECPDHKIRLEKRKEESYFFRLSRYQDRLLKLYDKRPDFISPTSRTDEVRNRVKSGLKDLSITRENLKWGIPFPLESRHATYVWFDALTNYVSALGGRKGALFRAFWPADIHIVGKEINWFHSVIWPAILFSVGIKPPKKILVHGWWLVEGQKMSKSVGNIVDPLQMANKYSVDSLRYYLLRDAVFGEDADFSEKKLVERTNGELVADLGNLVYRALTLAEKYKGKITGKPYENLTQKIKSISKHMEEAKISQALEEILQIVRDTNKYINQTEPWKLEGKKLGEVIYNLVERIRIISILIGPFMPSTSRRIFEQLGIRPQNLRHARFAQFKGRIKRGGYLFHKIEGEKIG
jgi:methionyl-tRNA synthetase